jgi:uncharacterized paraquat-inducible protein A
MHAEPAKILSAVIAALQDARRRTMGKLEQKRLDQRIAQAKSLARSPYLTEIGAAFFEKTPEKIAEFPARKEHVCPWCEKTHHLQPGETSRFCPDCRHTLHHERKEVLLDILGRVMSVNLLISSNVSIPPEILREITLLERDATRSMTARQSQSALPERAGR